MRSRTHLHLTTKSRLVLFFREALVLLVFCAMTAVLTWPYVNYLRDVVVDEGDPYLVSWIMWWNYHQTFTHPSQLFHGNIFYPYPYSLAFSEHMYGISLLFFPLFALGFRPLTVHAVAVFSGFVLSGYGAFRLARTLTGSNAVAWIAGIAFAFTPFRLDQMSQLPYLFTCWLPLIFEALVLFVRQTSWKFAIWFGCVFFMLGLSSLTWLSFSLVPLMLAGAVLLTRYRLWRKREFWSRGCCALLIASLGLLPFTIPYYIVTRLYGFTRSIEEVKANSAWPIHWLSIQPRNALWSRIGPTFVSDSRFRLFPGLLPLIFSAFAIALRDGSGQDNSKHSLAVTSGSDVKSASDAATNKWRARLDVVVVVTLGVALGAVFFYGTNSFGGLFNYLKSEIALTALAIAIVARCCFAYPPLMRFKHANLVETLRAMRGDALWLGLLLTALGFWYSLGWNFFFYRICYDVIPLFRAMRTPTRGAMYAYLGLAILAGLGAKRLGEILSESRLHWNRGILTYVLCAFLLFELNAAPLTIIRGDLLPDAVTLRLKATSMRGGVVMLPAGGGYNHHHVLRAADHGKPLITATSGFIPPYEIAIENLTNSGPITFEFLDLLERIPASYVVVMTHLVPRERKTIYENFFSRAVAGGRLRFINRFDDHNDLYAVVKTESDARGEAQLPFPMPQREWSAAIQEDPLELISHSFDWTRAVYSLYLAAFGRMPRYQEFIADMRILSKGVIIGAAEPEPPLPNRLLRLAELMEERDEFQLTYGRTSDEEFVERVLRNSNLQMADAQRAALIGSLQTGSENRASLLARVSLDPRLLHREQNRALVLVYYFAYLHRNPDDSPDFNLEGFNFWLKHLEQNGAGELTTAFASSIERNSLLEREHQK